ncbi:peptide chain release factor N(5)-glutamine methyltransferase [Mesomycoplasma conjunctivae]|uniref:peptide chain release factor N(5)-glutamine methyltransferase n=1 Tax=Mesomycoplasma conjunctivae TaxID=45361 RepID=UPI003DA5EA05
MQKTSRQLALLKEKQRYNLPLEISKIEQIKLDLNYPIQKIIGYVSMQNVDIYLDQKVFIPRYETEELLLLAYDLIDQNSKVLDIGCGSGFIAIAIAKNKKATVSAIDIDISAIIQTQLNAKINDVEIEVIQSDLFTKLDNRKFDLIISNPPYLKKVPLDDSVVNFEPNIAFFGEPKAYSFYQKIIDQGLPYLSQGGSFLFEIDQDSYDFFKNHKLDFKILKDINNKTRFAIYTLAKKL